MDINSLTPLTIEALAGSDQIYQRGVTLARTGAVVSIAPVNNGIKARVRGETGNYSVEIYNSDDDLLDAECTCPYDGDICKHIIAVLLSYREEVSGTTTASRSQRDPLDVVRQSLDRLSHTELVELVMRLAGEDEAFRRTLLQNMVIPADIARQQPVMPQRVTQLKKQITKFFDNISDMLGEYYETGPVDEIDDFLDTIHTFHPRDQTALLQHLIAKANDCLGEYGIDTGQVGDAVAAFGHAVATLQPTRAEKQRYYETLFDMGKLDIWDYGAEYSALKEALEAIATTPDDMRDLLALLDARLSEFPGLVEIVISLYRKLGDDKNYLALRHDHLTTEPDYLDLARFWQEKGDTGRYVATLESWLTHLATGRMEGQSIYGESGLGEEGIIARLLRYYQETDNQPRVLATLLKKAEFVGPTLALYKQVKEVAQRLGQWATVRPQFTAFISPHNARTQAEIYLEEAEWEAAIMLADAQPEYAAEGIQSLVALGIEAVRPHEALRLYKRLVEANIGKAQRKSYQVAANHAARIKEIYLNSLCDPAQWQNYIATIRAANSRRPALKEEFQRL